MNRRIDQLPHNNEDFVESQLRLLPADGQVRHVLSRAVALRHGGRTPYRIVGLDTDVTQVRRVQTVLDAVAQAPPARSTVTSWRRWCATSHAHLTSTAPSSRNAPTSHRRVFALSPVGQPAPGFATTSNLPCTRARAKRL